MDIEDVGDLAVAHAGVKRKGTDTRPAWYVDNRLVARRLDATSVVIRAAFEPRERLLERWPSTFSVPPRSESHHMVVVELATADPAAVAVAVEQAVALQRRG